MTTTKEKMNVRITFRSEIYFEDKDLADIAKQWEQIELVSVKNADTFEEIPLSNHFKFISYKQE